MEGAEKYFTKVRAPRCQQAFMFSYLWILTLNLGMEAIKLQTLGKEKRTTVREEMEL